MLYEIWETTSRNIVISFSNWSKMLEHLRNWRPESALMNMVLATEDDDGNTNFIVEGADLIALARRRGCVSCPCTTCNPSARRAPGWGSSKESSVRNKPTAPDVLKTAHDVIKQEEAQEGLKLEKLQNDFIQQEEDLAEAQLVTLNKPASPRLLGMLQQITTAPPPGVCQACGSETASTRSYCVGCVSLAHGLQGLAKAYPVSWNAFLQTAAKDDRS